MGRVGRLEMLARFWLESLKGRGQLEDLSVDETIILKWNFGKCGRRMWTEFIWLRTGTGEFRDILNVLLTYQEILCSTQLVNDVVSNSDYTGCF
jgi:hypothetical protein